VKYISYDGVASQQGQEPLSTETVKGIRFVETATK
jgi:hypothetical protein